MKTNPYKVFMAEVAMANSDLPTPSLINHFRDKLGIDVEDIYKLVGYRLQYIHKRMSPGDLYVRLSGKNIRYVDFINKGVM